ncbi:hypothetical protein Aasi_0945 [Candidatus Amoebophilus asiaticus 5a2]|uniref:F-box domain-containing protein n=1 Tax=Amoebophilus asiaticus (strain 5a2) TaxID=452471 RepID=B3ESV3_AMOA5|nr:F-box protein [Candidatus Amoebophilus asiaticus]ACE06305.1 hypothetical protein Aasi_0945 [Candidatus Amoebophilus asiaticus 5a2]
MQKFSIIFFSALLLSACKSKPHQVIDTTVIDKVSSNQARTVGEENKSIEVISLPKVSEASSISSIGQIGEQKPEEINGFTFHSLTVPKEIMLQIFSELSVPDITQASQVCRGWYELSEEPALWRTVHLRMHGYYSAGEATKEQAKLHMLRVRVHTLTDLTTAGHLITKYMLNQSRPFTRYQALVCELTEELTQEILDKQATQGNQVAIDRKIEGMADEVYGYDADPEAAVALNERLINQGNEKAINRKIYGLAQGTYGYKENIPATVVFIEDMASKGNQTAIKRKIDGYTYGMYGYQKHPLSAVNLIEHWVEQGSKRAIRWKVKGLANGMYGYKKDLIAAVNLNEALIEQGDEKAIGKKIFGLAHGCYGYEKDLEAAIALNQNLIEQGNEQAIIRKVKGLSQGKDIDDRISSLYQVDMSKLTSWLEEEESKGTCWAHYLKAQGLQYGILGFGKDMQAAIGYIKRHNIPY